MASLNFKKSTLLLTALLFMPALAFANEGEAAPGLTLYWINFLIFCGAVYYFAGKAIPVAWQKRCERLEAEVGRGKLELQAASQRLDTAKQKLATAQAEIEAIKQNISREAAEEARLLLAEARQKSVEIVSLARESAQAERKSVETGIRKELAELVITKVKQVVRSEKDGKRESIWRERAVGSIGNILN